MGYRHIDSSYVYLNEEEVGRAIQKKIADGTVKRDDIFFTSKVLCSIAFVSMGSSLLGGEFPGKFLLSLFNSDSLSDLSYGRGLGACWLGMWVLWSDVLYGNLTKCVTLD